MDEKLFGDDVGMVCLDPTTGKIRKYTHEEVRKAFGMDREDELVEAMAEEIRREVAKLQATAPNFRDKGRLFLVRCKLCGRENYGPAVASGTCAFCGWSENVNSGQEASC